MTSCLSFLVTRALSGTVLFNQESWEEVSPNSEGRGESWKWRILVVGRCSE